MSGENAPIARVAEEICMDNKSPFRNVLTVIGLVVLAVIGWNLIWWLLGAVGAIIVFVLRTALLVFIAAFIYYLVRGKRKV